MALASIGIGVGITYVASDILTLETNYQIIIAIVLTLATFVSLYFASKSGGQ
jgi:hypothetical protein